MKKVIFEDKELTAHIRQVIKKQIYIIDEVSTSGIAYEIYNMLTPEEELSFVIKNAAIDVIKTHVQKEVERLVLISDNYPDQGKDTEIIIDCEQRYFSQDIRDYI